MSKRPIELIDSMIEQEIKRYINKQRSIVSLSKFLLYKGDITEKEYEKIEKKDSMQLPKYALEYEDAYIEDILTNRYALADYYSKIIELYSDYDIGDGYYLYSDDVTLKKYFLEFLKYINCEELYNKLMKSGRITFPKKDLEGNLLGETLVSNNLSYIVVNDCPDRLNFYMALVHELGHALVNKVLYGSKGYFGQPTSVNEIIPILMEKLFGEFLLLNSDIDKKIIGGHIRAWEFKYFEHTERALEIFNILDNPNTTYTFYRYLLIYTDELGKHKRSFDDISWAIGNIVAFKIFEDTKNDRNYLINHWDEFVKLTEFAPLEQIIREFFDIGAISKSLTKGWVKKIS